MGIKIEATNLTEQFRVLCNQEGNGLKIALPTVEPGQKTAYAEINPEQFADCRQDLETTVAKGWAQLFGTTEDGRRIELTFSQVADYFDTLAARAEAAKAAPTVNPFQPPQNPVRPPPPVQPPAPPPPPEPKSE